MVVRASLASMGDSAPRLMIKASLAGRIPFATTSGGQDMRPEMEIGGISLEVSLDERAGEH